MQEWFVNNDMCSTHNLMCSTHNEGKSVITERFIQTLQAKIYKKVAANDSKPYVSYLNKFVDQYNKLIMILLIKNLLMLIILL